MKGNFPVSSEVAGAFLRRLDKSVELVPTSGGRERTRSTFASRHTAGADPLRQGRSGDGQAGPGKNLFLTIQRQVVAVLGDHHLDQQAGRGDAFVDDLHRNRCLDQRFALIADPLARDVTLDA